MLVQIVDLGTLKIQLAATTDSVGFSASQFNRGVPSIELIA
jgi:hypothetical protein